MAVPGPSALLVALAGSGLPTDEFRFIGFLPAKSGARRRALEQLARETATAVVYESPHRILETLADMAEMFGDRQIALCRELTKVHEEFLRGSAGEIRRELELRASIRGEITLVIGPSTEKPKLEDPAAEVARLELQGLSRMEAVKAVAKQAGLPKREVYRLASRVTPRLGGARDSNRPRTNPG